MLVDPNYFVLNVLFQRFSEALHYIKWKKEDARRTFCLHFPLEPNSFMLSPTQIWKSGFRSLSSNDGTGNTFVFEALNQCSFNELMLPVCCDVCVSVCCVGGENLGRNVMARRTTRTGGILLNFPVRGSKEDATYFQNPLSSTCLVLVIEVLEYFYRVLLENIPGDSVTSSCSVLGKILDLFRKPHLAFYFDLVLR